MGFLSGAGGSGKRTRWKTGQGLDLGARGQETTLRFQDRRCSSEPFDPVLFCLPSFRPVGAGFLGDSPGRLGRPVSPVWSMGFSAAGTGAGRALSAPGGGVNSVLPVLAQSFRFGVEIAYVGATILDVCKRVRKKTLVGGNHQSKAFSDPRLFCGFVFLFLWIGPGACALSPKVASEVMPRGRWPCCPGPTPTCLMKPSG